MSGQAFQPLKYFKVHLVNESQRKARASEEIDGTIQIDNLCLLTTNSINPEITFLQQNFKRYPKKTKKVGHHLLNVYQFFDEAFQPLKYFKVHLSNESQR